ncbi:hypothetical protein JL720_9667 [Aureococcus anophagefferens]|nr:hypothetical protein JL720_9667 [Aureococcus anophagefferens]
MASRTERPTFKRGRAKAVYDGIGLAAPSISGASAASGLPNLERPYCVLGIETSCDDTAAAVVRSDGAILGEAVVSQHEIHAQFGGIVPGLARDAHAEAIDEVVALAVERAGLDGVGAVDAVAATVGPGLEICLRVGARKAVDVAEAHAKPFVAMHHLEAHCLISRLPDPASARPEFPPVDPGVGDIAVLGGTLDDALGEAYDKAARMLGLAAPTGGGPRSARRGRAAAAIALPVPMRQRKDCDFSYAGLKNALRVQINERREALGLGEGALPRRRRGLRRVVPTRGHRPRRGPAEDGLQGRRRRPAGRRRADARARRRRRGERGAPEPRRRTLRGHGWALAVPAPRLCTDNGAMVAWAAIEKLNLGVSDALDDEVLARWPFREWVPPADRDAEDGPAIFDEAPRDAAAPPPRAEVAR